MKTILHTFGAAQSLELIRRLNFSHIIVPATLARPAQDVDTVALHAGAGLMTIFDLSGYRQTIGGKPTIDLFVAWAATVRYAAGFAGVWLSDVTEFPDGITNLQDELATIKASGVEIYASVPLNGVTAATGMLASVGVAAYPIYRQWAGDASSASVISLDSDTLWDRFMTYAAPSPMKRVLMLQAFFDRNWPAVAQNSLPTYAQLKAIYDEVFMFDPDLDGICFFGLSAAPGTQRRYLGLAQEPAMVDAVGMLTSTVLGRAYISPAHQMVRTNETRLLTCSLASVTWAIVRSPIGCSITPGGVFVAGNAQGEAVVCVTKDGHYAEATVMVYEEP